MQNVATESSADVWSCLRSARYHGLLPMWVDIDEMAPRMESTVSHWTKAQQAEAVAWYGRARSPGTDPAPKHVAELIATVVAVYRSFPSLC